MYIINLELDKHRENSLRKYYIINLFYLYTCNQQIFPHAHGIPFLYYRGSPLVTLDDAVPMHNSRLNKVGCHVKT